MKIHLVIPHAFAPSECLQFAQPNDAPMLRKLFARAVRKTEKASHTSDWIAQEFNLSINELAACSYRYDSQQTSVNSAAYTLRADPIYLQINQNHARLIDARQLALDYSETQILLQDLNAFFIQEEWQFSAPNPNEPTHWYLHCTQIPVMQMPCLEEMLGEILPAQALMGDAAKVWRRRLTELQMFLYAHPTNQARQARGHYPINSVWCWGNNDSTQSMLTTNSSPSCYWSQDALLQAVCFTQQARHKPLPCNATDWMQQAKDIPQHHTLLLEGADQALFYGGIDAYAIWLAALEKNWIAPLAILLKAGKIQSVQLTLLGKTQSQNLILNRYTLWKFWRKTASLKFLQANI